MDPFYRAFVWEHMLLWDLQVYRENGETVIDEIKALLQEFGVPEGLATQTTRDALQAIAQYQFYLNASKVDESARSEYLASLHTAGLSADDMPDPCRVGKWHKKPLANSVAAKRRRKSVFTPVTWSAKPESPTRNSSFGCLN